MFIYCPYGTKKDNFGLVFYPQILLMSLILILPSRQRNFDEKDVLACLGGGIIIEYYESDFFFS
jgi:hypothetical protein